MAPLREYLTPAEQERFKKLYNQGYFNQITFPQFVGRIQKEHEYIDLLQQQLDRATMNLERVTGSTARDVERRSELQYTIDYAKNRIPKLRAGAFDSALSGDLSGRTRRAFQDFDRATWVDADGKLTTGGGAAIPFLETESEKNLMALDLEKQIHEQGWRYPLNLAASMMTGPIRATERIASGQGLGENPLEAIAEFGSLLPIGRAFGRAASASRLGRTAGGQLLSRAVRSPLWTIPSYTAQASDIIGAGEGAYSELLAEVGIEAVGAGGDLLRHLKSRGRGIFQGLDPQAAEDAQTTESTVEHDDLTGSRTAPGTPGLSPEATRAAERAAADSAVESADAQVALDTATQQHQASLDQQLRREAWERILIASEERDAAEAEQSRIEQSFIDQDDAYTQQQAADAEAAAEQQSAEAEKVEFTKTWLPFYSDLAGGSQSEGIRLLNQEYDAGVRNPIAHRYDQIAAQLQPQMGVAPSELHREADRRLRQLVGEKWYNIYRGIDQRPTPQQRAQRAVEAADKIVEGTDDGTDTDTGTTSTGTQQTGGDTQQGSPETQQPDETDVDNVPATDIPDGRDSVPASRVGTENTGYESDGVTGHRVRPVLRELDEIVPSHKTDGEKREDYPQDLQPREGRGGMVSMEQVRNTARTPNFAFLLEFFKQFRDGAPVTSKKHPRRILSGNGRTLALQLMRQDYPENWQGYQDALRAELEKVGIDPAEADAMDAPVLTYELMDDTDEVALAKDANVQATLDHTATEQAGQDAAYFDDDLMALWQPSEGSFEEVLTSEENQQFRTTLFSRIPTHLVSAFMTADNKSFSNDGIQRIQNAMIRYVFGESIGDRLASVLIEQGLEDVKNIESMLRNAIAALAYAKANGQDISTDLASAIFRFIEINKTADREAQQRKQPKDVMLYAGIDAFYQSGALIDAPSLLEKQLLYLVYAKRNAPRQLADDFQVWAQNAVARGHADREGDLFSDVAISEAIFAGIIRDYIQEKIFETRVTPAGQTELLPPDSMPPELVNLRQQMDAMSDAADKQRFVNDWIGAFLRMMNEGQPQQEVDPNATETESPPESRVAGTGTGTPEGTGGDQSQGTPDTRRAAGTSETPEGEGGVAPPQPGGTDRDVTGAAEGAADSVSTDDRGESINVLADRIDPDRHPGASPRQIFTLAVVEHLRFTDQPLTETQLIAGYSKALGLDVAATHLDTEGHITDMHGIVDAAIEETLQKKDVEEKGITREDLEARLPTQRQRQEATDETTENNTMVPDMDVSAAEDNVGTPAVSPTETAPDTQTGTQTSQAGGDQESETIDTNQVVGTSRRIETPETTVSPVLQRDLDTLGITIDEWERMKADGEAVAFINNLTPEQQEQVEWAVNLTADVAGEMPDDAMADEDLDIDDDEDYFSDFEDGRLRDITDQQRSDFDTIRRKSFLAKTIGRLEAKGKNRTPVETAQLRALTAPQRTDAQQKIYEELLTTFVDNQVARLKAKASRTATEDRILETLTAVQAEGLPEEASDLSLYADLDTPDQAHSSPLAETRTLAGVQAPETADTELNLPEDVTADTTKLSPAQQSSVKAIVAAFLRKIHTTTDTTVQGGFLLGDKPGVGKTRQALATIWHYMRQGINRHFVLAPNLQLLDNYSKDMDSMGGPVGDISNYTSSQKVSTPIGTATYSMLIRTPNIKELSSRADGQSRTGTTGFQNAVADIVEHLTGARPTFAQTHPERYQAQREAFMQIFPSADISTVEKAITELQKQASRINLKNRQAVEQFRARVTPRIADLLLSPQGELFSGSSELYQRVWELLEFGDTVIAPDPDPDFDAKAAAFEGVIVLDEMHKAAGTDSQTGQMIATLHRLLPNAKFLYMSATPFKEIDNFWVAERLGLWGANQPFPTFSHFARAFRRAARAVKEIVPLHLKQIGRYVSRALSSKETRYTPVELPLSDTEKRQYDTAVQLVQGIRQRFEAALDTALRSTWGSELESEGEHGKYRAKYMRMFYGETQKFFLAVLDAMKAQGLEENIREKLQNGDKVILQLENTWEKSIERAKARGKREGTIGPFDLLIDFVESENMFPIHEHIVEVRTRRDGTQYTVVVPRMEYNENGERVRAVDPNLKRLQTQMIEALRQEMRRSVFSTGLPFAADIIHTIALEAGATSGEISGRSDIYPRDNPQRMPQDTESRVARTTAFSETTDLNLIVLGPAGLTGINLPIAEKIKNEVGALYHYLVQSSWNVNTFEQGLGRGKRANSAIDPHYMIAHQDLPGADRVLGATLAKFAEMGALAGQADNALMQNIDKVDGETSLDDDPEAEVDTDVFDTEGDEQTSERGHIFGLHGREALEQLWLDIYNSGDFSLVSTLGLTPPEMAGATGIIDPDTIPTVQQFFSRLLHQSTENQPRFYQQFEEQLKRIIVQKKEIGQLDVGASNLNSSDGQITDRLTLYTDPDTGQTAEMVRLDVKRDLPRRSWDFMQKVLNGEPGYTHYSANMEGFYTDADGHIWAVFEVPFRAGQETEYIRWGPRGTPVAGIHAGENRITEDQLHNDFTRITDIAETQRLWEVEDATADTEVASEMFMATGLILPKWEDLSWRNPVTGMHELPVMGVIPMLNGSHLHGRVIPSSMLTEVLTRIGGVDPNHFSNRSSADSNQQQTPTETDIDIPAIVRDIIGQQTDTKIAARLNNIAEHIHKKLPLRLRGHLVRSAAEAALLGQLIRDPQVEHTWIVYRKNDRIVKIEPMSLNRKYETKAGDFDHIKKTAAKEGADSILRIHNHPSGVAKWSPADKSAAMNWHRELGTLMAEDIIVDSGTYAYRTFENGQYTWHQDTVLDPQAAGFDTGTAAVSDPSGEVKPTDPLYQNPLIRGAREAATYMMSIKHGNPNRVAEMIFVDTKTGKIVDTVTDVGVRTSPDPITYLENALAHHQGQQVHIALWGDDAAVSLARSLQGVEGVDSVWVNEQRVTGIEHIGDQTQETITKDIGGQNRRFVRVDDTVSDPNTPASAPIQKSFMVAGVQRDLGQDPNREDPFKRTPGDAEHIVSAKRRLDVERLDPTALEKARRVIEAGIQQFTSQDKGLENKIQQAKADIANTQAYKEAINDLNFRSVRTIGDLLKIVEATPILQTDEIRNLFKGLDPATERWDTDIGQNLNRISREAASKTYDLRSELDELKKTHRIAAEVGDNIGKIRTLHADLNRKTAYKDAIGNLSWQHVRSKTIQEVLDFIEATPILQTDEVKALFTGIDPATETWKAPDGLLQKIQNLGSQAWDDISAINRQLLDIRNAVESYQARATLDLVEEINQSHRMSIDRIEQGIQHLPESTQVAIEPALEQLWGHISTEAGVLNTVLESGVIKALSKTGDPNINEGMLAYTSWSSYYRRSQGFHDNGVILDLELILDTIPNITGTVHVRNDWGERMDLESSAEIREAMETWKDTDEDIVIEIRIPQDIDINTYLIGIIEDSKVYVEAGKEANPDTQIDQSFLRDYTAQVQRTNPDSAVYRVHAPEDLSMTGRGRAKTVEIGEKALNTFIDSNAGIMKVLKAWSPTARKWARMGKNEFISGFGKLTDLEAPEGSDAPAPADIIKEILRERQYIAKSNAGRALAALEPHLLAFNKLARKRTRLRTSATAPSTRKARRTELSRKVWDFIEYNTPIENDPALLEIAEGLKDTWREILIYDTQKIVELMGELESINETLYVTDAQGKRTEWYGESFDGFQWDAENRTYTKDGRTYTIEEAHRAANKLYMPHYFRGKSPLQEYSALQKTLDALNTLLAAETVDADALQPFEIEFDTGTSTYTHTPTGKTASTPYEMVRIVANYLSTEDAALQGILNYYQDEGRVGYYGHLERTRETDDRFYVRDIALMAENRIRLWDRLAEVATLGQQHPLLGDSPRMKTLIEQVMTFDKTPREAALRAFVEALNSGQEGMFERMPQFASGVETALDIMQHWMERDADGEKTGNYQEIDIGRMNLDADTLAELERIGLIETVNGRQKIVGEDIAQRHATMAQHIHEFYNTLAQRKNAVHSVVLGLSNWHSRDPLEMESAVFWKKINDTITVLTLNHGVAIQNLLEIPLISMLVGANPLFKGLKNMSNREFRDAMLQLARGLSHARKFMADTSLADKYLGSPLTYFSKSDEFSRAAGLGIGLENAKAKIQRYAEADGKKRDAIGREMDAVRLNKDVIANIPAEQIEQTLAAAEELILNNAVDTVFSSEKGAELSPAEQLAGTMLRSMYYISDETFKQYDATSLPQFMLTQNPLIRVFMKYKSWMLQQNRLVYNQLKRAYRETKKGNLEPLGNFVAASAMMGLGTGGLLWAYSLFQGDEDDKAWQERLFKGLAAAQTFGIASVMFELAMYAEGNWYQMSNLLAKQAAGPTFSVAAQMIGPVLTGDFERAGTEALRRVPIVSFSRRVGGWRLLEEATGTGEEEE